MIIQKSPEQISDLLGVGMLRKLTIRKKLTVAILIGIFVPFIFGGFYLNNFVENWLYNNNFEVNERILKQVSQFIDYSLVSDIEEKVNMLSELESVKESVGHLSDYTDYEPKTYSYTETDIENMIESVFKIIKDTNSSINFIFFGTEEGGYIEYPKFAPTKHYDPRIRAWYENTIDKEDIVISDPYITQLTQDMVISITKRVKKESDVIGVIGTSVKIDKLTSYIEQIHIGESGYIIVMNENDKIVVSPKEDGWLRKTPDELNIKSLMNLNVDNDEFIERNIGGIDSILNVVISPKTGWKMISVVNKTTVLKNAEDITSILMSIYMVTMIIILVIVFNISSRITKPIVYISHAISNMAMFKFTLADKVKINEYSNKNDEIGQMSKALIGMNSNFVALTNQVEILNEEINNIDIENKSNQLVHLSKENPFAIVVDSMNSLLDKVNLYLDKLRNSNSEVSKKNELLVATEEVLRMQIDEIDAQKRHIHFLAYHDPLTELPNRRKFVERFNSKLEQGFSCAVILLDLDNFKAINDTMGHVHGDKVLKKVAERLINFTKDDIFISRFGGDEFLILIEGSKENDNFEPVINELSHLFDKDIEVDGHDIDIKYSMGISLYPHDSEEVDKLIMYSDLALYAVKGVSKNSYKYFDKSMMKSLLKKSEIDLVLRDAIANDGFKLVYQPIINVLTGEADSFEALLRLKEHNLSPGEFIPVAEEMSLIIPIGRLVTEKIIIQLDQWKKQGLSVKKVALNFSTTQMHDSTYLNFMENLFSKYDIDPKLIEIEITENVFLDNKEFAIDYFAKFRALGIAISIDDFGTGYSSLSYLMSLPIDKIKLDRSLNIKFLELENIQVLDSLISLVHGLKLKVVAEGIEELEHVRRLRVGKCDFIQGYYFSRPLEVEDVPSFMNKKYL
jgi:diguanylate cyclase (GGDEF)-like protein